MLDLCCGTGDLALRLAKLARDDAEIMGLDFSEPMLKLARRKAVARNLERKVSFLHGDVADLPFPDGYFTVLGISFAFRNIIYRNPLRHRYLAEIVRVLAPGGRCIIVETSQPHIGLLRGIYHLYLRTLVSGVGGLLSRHHRAYRYLAESARRFYMADEVSRTLIEAGFQETQSQPLLWGIAAIHVATR
jgi:demethylmenaquinone methyltransferase/2-methoxy-6-polyprenyl-1,4-benzoquinol methylase